MSIVLVRIEQNNFYRVLQIYSIMIEVIRLIFIGSPPSVQSIYRDIHRIRVNSAPSQVGPGQLSQVNSACMGAQVWGKGG